MGEKRGLDVTGNVVHGDERLAVHVRQALGKLDPDEQRADEPRSFRDRNRGQIRPG